jgi:deoxyribonuclease-4
MLRLGGHLKSTEGLNAMILATRSLGYNIVQTMLGEGRSYEPREIATEDLASFRGLLYGIDVVVHMPFVINPCEDAPQRRAFYRKSFRDYAQTAAGIGAKYLVLHPGFRKELSPKEARLKLVDFIEKTFDETQGPTLLLETDSGSKNGSAVGSPAFIGGPTSGTRRPAIHY